MKRTYEPLGGPAKQCQLVPIKAHCHSTHSYPPHNSLHHTARIKVAIAVALSRGSREVLEALGGNVPTAWVNADSKADRMAANDEQGEVPFVCACVMHFTPPGNTFAAVLSRPCMPPCAPYMQ